MRTAICKPASQAPSCVTSRPRATAAGRRLLRLEELDQRHPLRVAEVGAVFVAGVRIAG